MPKVYTTIPNAEQTILRPVIYSVIDELKMMTGLKKDIDILYPGHTNTSQVKDSDIEGDALRAPRLASERFLFLEVEYDHQDHENGAMDAVGRFTTPVFNDPKLGVEISPIYSSVEVRLNIRYRTRSQSEALRWRDDIRMRVSQNADVRIHTLHYSYTFQPQYVALLKTIHHLRESQAGYGDDFLTYLKHHSSDALTTVANANGSEVDLVFKETQTGVQGYFDFTLVPEKAEYSKDEGIWEITIPYIFQFDKVIASTMKYPLMVHNQPLPDQYLTWYKANTDLRDRPLVADGRVHSYRYFSIDNVDYRMIDQYASIRIPEFDDFIATETYPGMCKAIQILCQIDPEHPQHLFNLNDLGDFSIDPDILDMIKDGEYQYLTKPYTSILNIALYRNGKLIEYTALEVDSDLNVSLANPPEIRYTYHVVIGVLADVHMLPNAAIERYKNYPEAIKKCVSAINAYISKHPNYSKLGIRGKLTKFELTSLFRTITGRGTKTPVPYTNPSPHAYQDVFEDIPQGLIDKVHKEVTTMKTVMNSYVIAKRKEA